MNDIIIIFFFLCLLVVGFFALLFVVGIIKWIVSFFTKEYDVEPLTELKNFCKGTAENNLLIYTLFIYMFATGTAFLIYLYLEKIGFVLTLR